MSAGAPIPIDDVLEAMDAKHVARPYTLAPSWKIRCQALAHASCYRCHGSGVSHWRNRGAKAVVCVCVKRSINEKKEVASLKIAANEPQNDPWIHVRKLKLPFERQASFKARMTASLSGGAQPDPGFWLPEWARKLFSRKAV